MISLTEAQVFAAATSFMLVSVRLFGVFLAAPFFGFRAFPMQIRVSLTLFLALLLFPNLTEQAKSFALAPPTFFAVALELFIGLFIGFVIRVGMMAIELAAEVLSVQTGLSFATSYVRDPNIASGLVGEFLGLTAIALMFAMNLHLVMLDFVMASFKTLPFGTWPGGWNLQEVVRLLSFSFGLGMVLALPTIVVYTLFYIIQAILARTSPQFNLFAVGFAITVPLAFVVLMIILPDLPAFVQRALEPAYGTVRMGLGQ
ncbi:MAG: hypothetical protein RL483_1388 [Pseudomonadota bacterium]|jgi:flagellar biosynthetic protein FliR